MHIWIFGSYAEEKREVVEAAKAGGDEVDRVYVEEVLPEKMKINLESLREFSLGNDLRTLLRTIVAVFR